MYDGERLKGGNGGTGLKRDERRTERTENQSKKALTGKSTPYSQHYRSY